MPCETTELVKLPPIIIDEVSQFVTHYTQIKATLLTSVTIIILTFSCLTPMLIQKLLSLQGREVLVVLAK